MTNLSLFSEFISFFLPRDFGPAYRIQTLLLRLAAFTANLLACIQLYKWHHAFIYEFYIPLPWSALGLTLSVLGVLVWSPISIFFDIFSATMLFAHIRGWALDPRIYGRWDGSWTTTSMRVLFIATGVFHCIMALREIFRLFRGKGSRRSENQVSLA